MYMYIYIYIYIYIYVYIYICIYIYIYICIYIGFSPLEGMGGVASHRSKVCSFPPTCKNPPSRLPLPPKVNCLPLLH